MIIPGLPRPPRRRALRPGPALVPPFPGRRGQGEREQQAGRQAQAGDEERQLVAVGEGSGGAAPAAEPVRQAGGRGGHDREPDGAADLAGGVEGADPDHQPVADQRAGERAEADRQEGQPGPQRGVAVDLLKVEREEEVPAEVRSADGRRDAVGDGEGTPPEHRERDKRLRHEAGLGEDEHGQEHDPRGQGDHGLRRGPGMGVGTDDGVHEEAESQRHGHRAHDVQPRPPAGSPRTRRRPGG